LAQALGRQQSSHNSPEGAQIPSKRSFETMSKDAKSAAPGGRGYQPSILGNYLLD